MDDGYEWITPLYYGRRPEPIGGKMEAQGTKINQAPELYLAADVEPYAKGGWKTTVKASVRVFDGDKGKLYDHLETMLTSGLNIARISIAQHEEEMKPTPMTKEEIQTLLKMGQRKELTDE